MVVKFDQEKDIRKFGAGPESSFKQREGFLLAIEVARRTNTADGGTFSIECDRSASASRVCRPE